MSIAAYSSLYSKGSGAVKFTAVEWFKIALVAVITAGIMGALL